MFTGECYLACGDCPPPILGFVSIPRLSHILKFIIKESYVGSSSGSDNLVHFIFNKILLVLSVELYLASPPLPQSLPPPVDIVFGSSSYSMNIILSCFCPLSKVQTLYVPKNRILLDVTIKMLYL